ncbi:MAG: DUF885 domain-containing protein [Proteobacteria bacterium]|nr:DUF885 domain-containing protein [Pseudomonadota bacterium]
MRMTSLAAFTISFCLAIGAAAATAGTPTLVAADAATAAAAPANSTTDAKFTDLAKRWLDGSMRLSPIGATQTGDHRFDADIDDLSAAGRAKSLAFSKQMLSELDAIDASKLSRENQVDAALLRNQLHYDVWNAERFQAWAWDPTLYTGVQGGAIYTLMARDFAPLPERLRSATARIEKLPALFTQMRENLDPARVPLIFAQTASKQNHGVLDIIDGMIVPGEKDLPAADRARLDAAIANLRKVVADQQTWIDKTLVPNAKGNFRIGKELFDEKLHFALDSSLSREEIRKRAQAEIVKTREQMYAIARGVLQGKPGAPATPEHPTPDQQQAAIQYALDMAAAERPARDQVVATAKAELAKATDFVRAHDLITLPNSPVQVILMPEFQRGVAVAYCDSPGPLDKNLATFYAVSPIPDDWKPEQVTSFLKEYNTRAIAELGVHEAMPGHYVQLWHSNQFPSIVRAVLGSGSFIEGWAVYAEHMMAEQGFLDHDPLYRLVQLKWYLRATANALLDQGIHVDGMTREQAMDLMTKTAFQEQSEAAGKWVRAQLSSAQLSTYFVGVQEHFDLLREAHEKWGKSFNLKRYHDTVTSFGSPPARYVGELMFDQPIK